ncbi:MAG TPA: hypothetical protein VHX37_07880 [Acidobacteriaceae bacterium]|jgi:hypothetical protein|nr:hypothetical protein [Acidobacteriaceae bacterium]
MFPLQFLLILLAATTIPAAAQTPAQTAAVPRVVPPPFSTVQPLPLGPALDPAGPTQISPLPVDYGVEHPLLLQITVFREEPAPEKERRSYDPSTSRFFEWSTRVSTDGTRSGSASWGYLSGGAEFAGPGGATPVPKDVFAKIKSLLAALPDVHGRLPPRNHKVQVEIATPAGTETRMYDAANLPEPLLEIFRLTESNFTPLVPEFAPEAGASAPAPQAAVSRTILAVSHDRRFTVVLHGNIDNWVGQIHPQDAQEIASGRQHAEPGADWAPRPQVLDQSGQLLYTLPPLPHFTGSSTRYTDFRAAWFTPNNRSLVLSTDVPDIRIYNTRSWQPIESLRAIPAGALDFEPSPDWKRAIVVLPSGEIDLWDVHRRRSVARIDRGGELSSAVWAPDSRQVAVSTVGEHAPGGHLRVWQAQTGQLEHELLAFEQALTWTDTPLWWPDGKYLLAHTKAMFGPPVIGIWDVRSGRYHGSFTHADCNAGHPLLSLDDGRLTMECENQGPVTWDASAAIQKIVAFEDSLHQER